MEKALPYLDEIHKLVSSNNYSRQINTSAKWLSYVCASLLDLAYALQTEVYISSPSIQALNRNASSKILSICPTQRETVTQPSNGADACICVCYGVEAVGSVGAWELVLFGKGGEGVRPDIGNDFWWDTAATVADADGDARCVIVQGLDGVVAEQAALRVGGFDVGDGVGGETQGRLRCYGHDDRLLGPILDGGAEGVLEHLGDYVLEVHGDRGKGGVWFAINHHRRSSAVTKLADVSNKASARLDHSSRLQGGVNDANEGRVLGTRRGARLGVKVRLAAEVEGNVLFGDEAGADAGAQVLVEEAGDLGRGDVLAALEEPPGEDGDGVGVGGDELGEGVCELDLVLEGGDGTALGGGAPVRQQDREGVDVGAVDAGDVGVGDDDIREVA